MISIQKLTRRYGPTVAVSDVSLDIQRGEIVGLLGHNGAGKTTVMKMLTGYLEPTSGTITVGGVDAAVDRAGVQRQIGYLPENAPLYPEMLVQEYLLMMAELRGIPAPKRREAVGEAVRQTGLVERQIQPIGTLSKGYRQRVGLAQAIVHKPDVLVLDEPTNGLDPMQIQSIRELIQRLGKSTTIILSTHILQEIEAVCERVLVMIDGRLVADRKLRDMLAGRNLTLTLDAGATGVEARLTGVQGVGVVRKSGGDGVVETWTVSKAEGADPTPLIAKAAVEAGWTIRALAPEHTSLEDVFKRLQREAAQGVAA